MRHDASRRQLRALALRPPTLGSLSLWTMAVAGCAPGGTSPGVGADTGIDASGESGSELGSEGESDTRGPLPDTDADGSCKSDDGDSCGGQSAGKCWCDDLCADFGDCCSDVDSVCGCQPVVCAPNDCGKIEDGCGGMVQCDVGCMPSCELQSTHVAVDVPSEAPTVLVYSPDVITVFSAVGGAYRFKHDDLTQLPSDIPLNITNRVRWAIAHEDGFIVAIGSTDGGGQCQLVRFESDGDHWPSAGVFSYENCLRSGLAAADSGFGYASMFSGPALIRLDENMQRVAGDASTYFGSGTIHSVAVAYDSDRSRFLAAYPRAEDGQWAMHAAFVSSTGFLLDEDILVGTPAATPSPSGPLSLLRTDDGFALAWAGPEDDPQQRGAWLLAVDEDSNPHGEAHRIGEPESFSVAYGGGVTAVAYELRSDVTAGNVRIEFFDALGAATLAPIELSTGPSDAHSPKVAWIGDGFAVVYMDDVDAAGVYDMHLAKVCAE